MYRTFETRMHFSRMRTVRCSGCHACPPPSCHACPLATHAPLPCMSPTTHTPLPCTLLPHMPPPPAMHGPSPAMHTPPHTHTPAMYTPPATNNPPPCEQNHTREFTLLSNRCGEGGGPHVTITHDALDLTVQGSPPPDIRNGPPGPQTSDMGHLRTPRYQS